MGLFSPPQPAFNQLWRFKGDGGACGMTFRILRITWKEIVAVHNSPQPCYSWLGDTEEFTRLFVYLDGDGAWNNRQKGYNIFGW